MKIAVLSVFCAALALSAFGAPPASRGSPTSPGPAAAAAEQTLAVIIVDSIPRHHTGFDDFPLMSLEFGNAFEARHWPVAVTFERFAANNQPHALELKVFNQGIRNEIGEERRFRAWVILTVDGTKHDFGIVDFRYLPRPGEMMDDVIHKMYRGGGEKIAQLIEPYLVPTANK